MFSTCLAPWVLFRSGIVTPGPTTFARINPKTVCSARAHAGERLIPASIRSNPTGIARGGIFGLCASSTGRRGIRCGFWSRFFSGLVAAREREARLRVSYHLRSMSDVQLRQIGFADLVVLNKTDLVGPEHIEVIREWIGLHKQPVRIIETAYCDVPLEVLLGVGRFDSASIAAEGPAQSGTDHLHHPDAVDEMFDRWSYRTTEPLSIEELRRVVQRELPESVYRCKGVIYAADSPETRVALQVVGGRVQIVDIDEWGERPRLSEIVAIGHHIDSERLNGLFDACVARDESA